jgi:hypothetical protein
MKIKTVEYAETKTQPGFNNVKVGFIAEVEKDEDPDVVLKLLKEKVGIETSPELRSYYNYIESAKIEIENISKERTKLQAECHDLKTQVAKYKITKETLEGAE